MNSPLVLHIPVRTPSLNDWQRMHWTKRRKVKDTMTWALVAESRRLGLIATDLYHNQRPRLVYVTRSHRGRPLDQDNAIASVKPLLDALVGLSWLKDDAPQWCSLAVTQRQDAEPWTEVRLEPMEGPR